MTKLTARRINQNYREALALSSELAAVHLSGRGYDPEQQHEWVDNLAQSALADERVVMLLRNTPYDRARYLPILKEALDDVRKVLFPDVKKRRFVSIDGKYEIPTEMPDTSVYNEEPAAITQTDDTLNDKLRAVLSPEAFAYWQRYLAPLARNRHLPDALCHWAQNGPPASIDGPDIEKRLQRFMKIFPDGRIPLHTKDAACDVSEEPEALTVYKKILCGLERFYPKCFLDYNGKERAALIIRFLLEEYLKTDPYTVLQQKDSTFFIQYKIQNIYRLFNYSMNRVLYNAYPCTVKLWMSSRIPENYWEEKANRVEAIRWLVEDRLGLDPQHFKKPVFHKKAFAENGLSYMFVQYYNSVSRALQEAYPQLEPWETGNVPKSYWTEEHSARAVRRMCQKNNWKAAQLPALYKSGVLNRKTFSRAGLATLFELRFGKNIYRAVNAAFPGQFEPWQFGKVPSVYWQQRQHVFHASCWIARQEGLEPRDITGAIRQKQLTMGTLKKYSIGTALKKYARNSLVTLYLPFFQKEFMSNAEERRIHKKINRIIRGETGHPLVTFLFYGIFTPLVRQQTRNYIFRLERMQKRRDRYRSI